MSKQKKRVIHKKDIVSAITNQFYSIKRVENKIAELDILLAELIDMLDCQKEFEEHLDGKYKQPEDEPSGGSSTTSEK